MLSRVAIGLLLAQGVFAFSTGGGMALARGRGRPTPCRGVRALRAQFEMPKFNLPKFSFGDAGGAPAGDINGELKQRLLDICSAARQGIDGTGPVTQEEFDALVEELIAKNPTPAAAESPLMTGTWRMMWTTEKEILFCVEKGLFGLPCTDVYQTIDAGAGTLANAIEFTDEGFLKVNSNFKNAEGSRFEFKVSKRLSDETY